MSHRGLGSDVPMEARRPAPLEARGQCWGSGCRKDAAVCPPLPAGPRMALSVPWTNAHSMGRLPQCPLDPRASPGHRPVDRPVCSWAASHPVGLPLKRLLICPVLPSPQPQAGATLPCTGGSLHPRGRKHPHLQSPQPPQAPQPPCSPLGERPSLPHPHSCLACLASSSLGPLSPLVPEPQPLVTSLTLQMLLSSLAVLTRPPITTLPLRCPSPTGCCLSGSSACRMSCPHVPVEVIIGCSWWLSAHLHGEAGSSVRAQPEQCTCAAAQVPWCCCLFAQCYVGAGLCPWRSGGSTEQESRRAAQAGGGPRGMLGSGSHWPPGEVGNKVVTSFVEYQMGYSGFWGGGMSSTFPE